MAETVYRLLQDEGITIVEDAATKTVRIGVPGLASKLNNGDIVQATQLQAGIAAIATNLQVQTGTDPDRFVTPAGLSSAAQSALNDATAARLMRVGGFGLGGAALVLTSQDLNAERPTGFYYCVTCTNGPIGNSAAGDGWLLHRDHSVSGYASQIYDSGVTDRIFFRRQVAGAWSTWRELYHTANFDPNAKANTSGNYPGLVVGNSAQVGGQTAAMLAPPGAIMDFAMPNPPNGWLAANGAAVSRATYADLFAAIGTTFGAGNGSSTFNLPDLRGYFRRSWDNGRGVDPGRGFASTQSSANLSHSHSGSTSAAGSHAHGGSTSTAGDHAHQQGSESLYNLYGGGNLIGFRAMPNGSSGSYQYQNTSTAGAHAHSLSTDTQGLHAHSVSTDPAGSNEARPLNIAFLTCIKF